MRISVTIKPNAHEMRVEKVDAKNYHVYIKEMPIEGRANTELIKTLAEHFNIAPSCVEIFKGHTTRKKMITLIGL